MFSFGLVRPRHGSSRRRTGASVAAVTAAAVVSGLVTAPVASSAPSPACPDAFPLAEVAQGQPLTGLTVTSGTEPSSFTGEVIGVIDHPFGVAGMDIVMARLSSPEIDRVGVWSGMSGSPVYAADGRLVGAVSLGLSWGPSPIAGITPAEEMYRLRTLPAGTSARTSAGDTVEIPGSLGRRIVGSGVVPRAAADQGLSPLPLPLGISGMSSRKRLNRLAKSLDLSGVRVHPAGAASPSGPAIPVVAGGNLAASLSYGDVSAVGIGTATAVCGDQVIGFGHPMVLTGPSRMTMHGADALLIHEDPLGPGFKLANPGAPVGSITQDRWEGISGVQGVAAIPSTTDVTSSVTVPGEWSRTGTTKISVPRLVPELASWHLVADQDRVFGGVNEGTALVGWTIRGHRADGRPWSLVRTDRFASEFDVSFEPYLDLYDHLARLQFNGVERVTVQDIRTTSTMERQYRASTITQVRVRAGGRWRLLRQDRPLFLRGGTTKRFRVRMTSAALGTTVARVKLRVPQKIGHKSGTLEIAGGGSFYSDPFIEEAGPYGGAGTPATFDSVLRELRRAPRNDQVLAHLVLFRRTGTLLQRTGRTTTRALVDGSVLVEVQGVG